MQLTNLGTAFNRLWTASLATNFGDGLLKVAAPLLAAFLTRDPVLISLVGAMGTLPWLLVAIPVGGLADRHDRRLLLAGANATRFAIAGAVAALVFTGHMTIGWLYVSIFLWGVCEVVADTTAQALIPQILDERHLERGNSRLNVAETIVQDFLGVPVSGLLYAVAVALPFALGAVGFAVGSMLLLAIPAAATAHQPRQDGTEHHTYIEDMKFGLNFLWSTRDLRNIVLVTTTIGVFYNMASSTQVLFLLEELDLPESQFGVLMTVMGLGAIAGSIITPRLSERFGRGNTLAVAIIIASVAFGAQGLAPNIWVYLAFGVLGVFVISMWNILLMAMYQVLIPKHLYGRVHGARRTLVWGMGPVGGVIGGFVATFGLRVPVVIGGILSTALAVLAGGFIRRLGNASSEPRESSPA